MSASIVQKNITTTSNDSNNNSSSNSTTNLATQSIYFECGDDIFNASTATNDIKHVVLSRAATIENVTVTYEMENNAATLAAAVLECKNNNNNNNNNITDNNTMNQQLQQKMKLKELHETQFHYHNALTRTVSQPQQHLHQLQQQQINLQKQQQNNINNQIQPQQHPPQDPNVATLVSTLIENLGNMNLHRKLERTQSEPLPQQQVNTSRYKTELCRPFEEAGECKYGEKCQFAHGYHELRNLQRHPKYKTEYCRTFHSVGFCPYGPRCHFVHNADEARAFQQQQEQEQREQQQREQQQRQQQQQNAQIQQAVAVAATFNNCITSAATSVVVAAAAAKVLQQQQQQQQQQQCHHTLPLSPPLSMSTGSDRESPTGSISLSPTSSMTNFPFGDVNNNNNNNNNINIINNNGGAGVGQTTMINLQQQKQQTTIFQNGTFNYTMNTPPESPNASMSPVNTPPPYMGNSLMGVLGGSLQNNMQQQQQQQQLHSPQHIFVKPMTKQLLQKSSSSPIAIVRNFSNNNSIFGNIGGHKSPNNSSSSNSNSSNSSKGNSTTALNGLEEARLPVFNRLSTVSVIDVATTFTAN